jgi:hypothetical protein
MSKRMNNLNQRKKALAKRKTKRELRAKAKQHKAALEMAKAMKELSLGGEGGAKEAGEIVQQLQLLTKGHNDLVRASTANFQAYSKAMGVLDVYVAVFQKVFDDILAGDVTTKEREVKVFDAQTGEDKTVTRQVIDWDSYFKYHQEVGEDRMEFLYGIPSPKKEEDSEEKPVSLEGYGENAVEFGG